MNRFWVYIIVGPLCYAIDVENDIVTNAPPVARWMIGKHYSNVKQWLEKKGAYIEEQRKG